MSARAPRRAAIALAAACAAVAAACHEPLPIPRIEPTLEGWAQPYAGLSGLRVHAFRTGAVRSVEGAAFAGGSWTTPVEMGAWAYVVEHPTAGLFVFDTGLAPEARSDPERYVGWLGARLGMLVAPEGASLPEQMRKAGLDPAAVRQVLVSHLHFDHTGSIGAFPNATVVVGAAEKAWLDGGVRAVDFVDVAGLAGASRWQVVDFQAARPLATLLAAQALVDDGSVLAVDLSGHTPGSMGLLLKTAEAPILLTGDAAWTAQSWKWPARPIAAADMALWWEQAWRIKRFAMLEPRLVVVPGHDDTAVASVAAASFVVHEAPGSEAP